MECRTILEYRRVIEFSQKALLKTYIDRDTEIRKKAKNDFESDLKLMNNVVFERTMENVSNHMDIKKEISWCQSLTTMQQILFGKTTDS